MTFKQSLVIREACRATYAKYAFGADSNIPAFVSCFTADARWTRPNMVMHGHDEIRAFMEKQLVDNLADSEHGHFTCHQFTTIHFEEVAETHAWVSAYGQVYRERHFSGNLPCPMALPELVVRYRTKFVPQNAEWLIADHTAVHLFR